MCTSSATTTIKSPVSLAECDVVQLRRGDLRSGAMGLSVSMSEGAKGHRRLQAQRPHGYEVEVPLEETIMDRAMVERVADEHRVCPYWLWQEMVRRWPPGAIS